MPLHANIWVQTWWCSLVLPIFNIKMLSCNAYLYPWPYALFNMRLYAYFPVSHHGSGQKAMHYEIYATWLHYETIYCILNGVSFLRWELEMKEKIFIPSWGSECWDESPMERGSLITPQLVRMNLKIIQWSKCGLFGISKCGLLAFPSMGFWLPADEWAAALSLAPVDA